MASYGDIPLYGMKRLVPLVIVVLFLSITIFQSRSKAAFGKTARIHLIKGCGNTLTENSSCSGTCVYAANGPSLTTIAMCGHGCVTLPAGKIDKDMNIAVSAAWQDGDHPPPDQNYKPCGGTNAPGPCGIGWTRFEGAEYYASTNEMCGRVKSWSSDQGTSFKIDIWQK